MEGRLRFIKEMEDYYVCLHERNEFNQKKVDKLLGESAVLEPENDKLALRKLETFHAVMDLNAQYERLDEVYQGFHLAKEEVMDNMRSKIDLLKKTITVKQQQLELLISGDAGQDFEVSSNCQCKAGNDYDDDGDLKLVYSKIMTMESKMQAKMSSTMPGGVAQEPEMSPQLATGDAGENFPSGPENPSGSTGGESGGSAPNAAGHDCKFICNFHHLFQLKDYLADKRNTKKVANSLTRAHKKVFKAALSQFCESVLEDLTKPLQDLKADMRLSQEQVVDHFEACLASEIKPRAKLALRQRFLHLLNKFGKKFPVIELSPKKRGFFKKLFTRSKNEVKKTDAERESEQLEVVEKMLRIEGSRERDVSKRMIAADFRIQFAEKRKLDLEKRIRALNLAMENTKLRMKIGALLFREVCKKQDAEIKELKMTILQMESRIELEEVCIRYLYSGMQIRNGGGDRYDDDRTQDASSALESRVYVCDVDL